MTITIFILPYSLFLGKKKPCCNNTNTAAEQNYFYYSPFWIPGQALDDEYARLLRLEYEARNDNL